MYADYYFDDITEDELLTEEEKEERQRQVYEERYNAQLSMDSLGLSWNDFI